MWGGLEEELAVDSSGGGTVALEFRHSILRSSRGWTGSNLKYLYPRFKNPSNSIYEIDTLSPAFRAGEDLRPLYPVLEQDLKGKFRSSSPTLGCLERIE